MVIVIRADRQHKNHVYFTFPDVSSCPLTGMCYCGLISSYCRQSASYAFAIRNVGYP